VNGYACNTRLPVLVKSSKVIAKGLSRLQTLQFIVEGLHAIRPMELYYRFTMANGNDSKIGAGY
jgi:hypothetical protein